MYLIFYSYAAMLSSNKYKLNIEILQHTSTNTHIYHRYLTKRAFWLSECWLI